MRLIGKSLLVILAIAVGAVFLFSAWTKVDPIQPFEYTMVEYLRFPWLLAAIAARFFIGLEAALGGLILLHLWGNGKWVLKTALWLLVAFSLYLGGLWLIVGNDVNCGCFGDHLFMSPAASLVKNAVLLAAILALLRFHNGLQAKWARKTALPLFLAGIALPFILFYIPASHPSWTRKDRYHLDLSPLDTISSASAAGLAKGKHIIAFLSPSCTHCKIAARKMRLMMEHTPSLPFFMVIGGEAPIPKFWKETNAQNVPWCRLPSEPFLNFTGGVFPLIIWVNDGWVEASSSYNTLNEADIEKWMK